MNMKSFLKSNAIAMEEQEFVVSNRFVDDDGNAIAWKIRVLGNDEIESIERACRKKEFVKGTSEYKYQTDKNKMQAQMICAAVVEPNLNDTELQESYGTIGAEATVKAMLTPGEYTDLANAVAQVAGFQVGMNDKIKTAKN